MEDDFSPAREGAGEVDLFSFHYQKMLSELWVCDVYEIFRLLTDKNRKLAPKSDVITALAHDLKLLRMPLEKHEIAAKPEAHIMPSEVSSRGSVRWHVIDVKSRKSYWLERRALSERIVAHWGPVAAEPPVSGDTAN